MDQRSHIQRFAARLSWLDGFASEGIRFDWLIDRFPDEKLKRETILVDEVRCPLLIPAPIINTLSDVRMSAE